MTSRVRSNWLCIHLSSMGWKRPDLAPLYGKSTSPPRRLPALLMKTANRNYRHPNTHQKAPASALQSGKSTLRQIATRAQLLTTAISPFRLVRPSISVIQYSCLAPLDDHHQHRPHSNSPCEILKREAPFSGT